MPEQAQRPEFETPPFEHEVVLESTKPDEFNSHAAGRARALAYEAFAHTTVETEQSANEKCAQFIGQTSVYLSSLREQEAA